MARAPGTKSGAHANQPHLLSQWVALGRRACAVGRSLPYKVGGASCVGEVAGQVKVVCLVEHELQEVRADLKMTRSEFRVVRRGFTGPLQWPCRLRYYWLGGRGPVALAGPGAGVCWGPSHRQGPRPVYVHPLGQENAAPGRTTAGMKALMLAKAAGQRKDR